MFDHKDNTSQLAISRSQGSFFVVSSNVQLEGCRFDP